MVKLILCRLCSDIICLRGDCIRECSCGNVRGKYAKDGQTALVRFKQMGDARIIGISNSFLLEKNISLDDPIYQGTLFGERKSNIIIMFPFTTGDIEYLDPKDE